MTFPHFNEQYSEPYLNMCPETATIKANAEIDRTAYHKVNVQTSSTEETESEEEKNSVTSASDINAKANNSEAEG